MAAVTIGIEKALDNEKPTITKISNFLSNDWTVVVPSRKVSLEGDLVLINQNYLIFVEIKMELSNTERVDSYNKIEKHNGGKVLTLLHKWKGYFMT